MKVDYRSSKIRNIKKELLLLQKIRTVYIYYKSMKIKCEVR